jgi:hypothetical protein
VIGLQDARAKTDNNTKAIPMLGPTDWKSPRLPTLTMFPTFHTY